MPAAPGTPSTSPLYDANAIGGKRSLPSTTTNTTKREPQLHPLAQAVAAAYFSTTGTTRGGGQPYRSAQEVHHGRSEDQEKGDSGSRTRYTDLGGQRTQGDKGEDRNILRKPLPSSKEASTRSTGTRERKEQSSNHSIDITMITRGGHSYSPTDMERRSDHSTSSSKPTAGPANVHPQPRHGSQPTSSSQAVTKEKPQTATHPETGSNASDTRVSDSINSRQPQLGSKPGQLPPGAAKPQLPITRRHRETQPGEDDSTDDHSNIAPSSGYLSGIGRTIAGAILGPGGPAQPPRDRTKEEPRARLQQLENEFRRARSENANLTRTCFELDSENRRNKATIRSLQQELTNMARELQEYKNLSDIRGKELVSNQMTPTDDEESLSAARAILVGTGAAPVMAVIDTMLVLRKEIAKVSDFLVENIRHTSYELFQEELDHCYRDSERIVGERLSKFLLEHCEAEGLSQSLIKITIRIFIASFCASEWEHYLATTLDVEADRNTAKHHKEKKAVFIRNLISVFKIAGWVIPGSANRVAFEESLNPFFKSMEEIEATWVKVPEFAKVSLSFFPPGEDLADWETYAEDATEPVIQASNGPSPSQNIVLGTSALGVRCLIQDRSEGVEDKPRTLLAAKVILEANLRYIFGVQEDQKPTTMSDQRTSQPEDGRDP